VNVFPEAQNVALFAAVENGLFSKRGVAVQIQFTSTSAAQREGLVRGDFEIAQAGVDNAIALVQTAKQDVIIVAGGGDGGNRLIVRPEVRSFADLQGKTVVVDSPVTAYAFLAYRMLELAGLRKGDYAVKPAGACPLRLEAMHSDPLNAAAMLNPPCSLRALRDGFHDLGLATTVVGPYQADGVWVMRSWAAAHDSLLVSYLEALIDGYRWAMDPANREGAAAILAKYLNLDPELAHGAVDAAVGPRGSLSKDAGLNIDAFRNTLRLRAEFAGGDPNADPERYVDLSYYRRAQAAH
jgi:ABC-type nitrate/sulfonate/bicarbonate transport system substrate-binding protein